MLPQLVGRILVPPAVVSELSVGRDHGLNLPDPARLEWIDIVSPSSASALPIVTDLGPGETAVLALALEHRNMPVILDDAQARRTARRLGLGLTGTLGLLLDAKQSGLISEVVSQLDRLQELGFRLDSATRRDVLDLAGRP